MDELIILMGNAMAKMALFATKNKLVTKQQLPIIRAFIAILYICLVIRGCLHL
jgi:hypothetical protein